MQQSTTTITTFKTQFNKFNIASIVLSQYDQTMINKLKENNFKYFSITKEWSKAGFNDLQLFESYCIAVFNNDTKMIKKLEPKKDAVIKQCLILKKAGASKRLEYINRKNDEKIQELSNIFDYGTASILLEYYKINKLDFWSISESEAKKTILNNQTILNDIVEFNNTNNIKNCSWIESTFNDGLPF